MVMGSAQMLSAARLASALNVPVASVEYRLAPETPFPGPQEDCYAALERCAIRLTHSRS
jgi:acetyl esterase